MRPEKLTRIREQLGVPPVEVPHEEGTQDGDEPTEAAEGPRPRHRTICKGEMEYVGGTQRPSARRMMNLLWDDIVRAVDAHPEPCAVRTLAKLCWERAQADLAASAASDERDAADPKPDTKKEAPLVAWDSHPEHRHRSMQGPLYAGQEL